MTRQLKCGGGNCRQFVRTSFLTPTMTERQTSVENFSTHSVCHKSAVQTAVAAFLADCECFVRMIEHDAARRRQTSAVETDLCIA